ncbi:MAG TPA: tetratricopeptide repeat protein [Candidatus Baltobacteraceae bacterium]|nr:tetratricopeptide repeat protein [Candidatus Baltobacteraceae bacterium]
MRSPHALVASLALAVLLPSVSAPARAGSAPPRDDYARADFAAPLGGALRAFYARDFADARKGFETALAAVPDNTLALSFLNATAAQTPGDLEALVDEEEDALGKTPKSELAHVRLAFSYLFVSTIGRDRTQDAREELNAALALDPDSQAAHTGLGIMRENERSANRAKTEFLAALETDPNNVLAREYLAQIYQTDLKDPQRALAEIVNVPNLVPDYADIYFHLASVMQDLGQNGAAVAYATRGLQTDVGHVGEAGKYGYTLLARIYIDERRLDDARRVLKAAISAGTDSEYASTLLAKLDAGAFGKPGASPPPAARKKP